MFVCFFCPDGITPYSGLTGPNNTKYTQTHAHTHRYIYIYIYIYIYRERERDSETERRGVEKGLV